MRTRSAIACVLLALAPAGIGAQGPDGVDAPRISMAEFKKLFAAKNVIVVDTRNEDAFPLSHIPGALLLPLEGQMTWPMGYEKTTVPKLLAATKPVVVYCA
jgi:rhodanese-related sulfurtransferase